MDPNVAAILDQHRQQHQEDLQQKLQIAHQQQQNFEQQQQHRDLKDKILDYCDRLDSADGAVPSAVRELINGITKARANFGVQDQDAACLRILQKKIKGDLNSEYERFLETVPNHDNVTWAAIAEHLQQAFLGPDDNETLK